MHADEKPTYKIAEVHKFLVLYFILVSMNSLLTMLLNICLALKNRIHEGKIHHSMRKINANKKYLGTILSLLGK